MTCSSVISYNNQLDCIYIYLLKIMRVFIWVLQRIRFFFSLSLSLVMTFACSSLFTVGLSLLILAVAWSILSLFQSKRKARLWAQKAGTLCLISGKCLATIKLYKWNLTYRYIHVGMKILVLQLHSNNYSVILSTNLKVMKPRPHLSIL